MNKNNNGFFNFEMQSFLAKAVIVLFFLGLIGVFLYVPRLYDLFRKKERAISLYVPREVFPPEKLEEFEALTGIKINVAYFDTNEEMFAKFKINRGEGYDLVLPSDYMVETLIAANLLQPLDHTNLSHFSELDPRLMNKFYDPGNRYSVPSAWIPYGIGYNRKYFTLDNTVSWEIMFKPEVLHRFGDYKISMLNDAREAIYLASIFLFGSVEDFSVAKEEKITALLLQQKPIVEAYMEAGAKYLLLSDIVPLAVIPAARMKEMGYLEAYGFVIPREGSLIDIMNLVIPAVSKRADLAHQLIDFLLSKEVGAYNFEEVACNPANKNAYSLIRREYSTNKAFFPDDKIFERLFILNNKIDLKRMEKIWFRVKSA